MIHHHWEGEHPSSPKVHYSEGSLVRRVRVRVVVRLGLGYGLGVKGYLHYIIFYYTLKTYTRQVRTSEPFSWEGRHALSPH